MPWDRKRDEKKSDRPPYELCARWWKMLLKIISIWKKYLSLFMEGYEIMDCDKFSPYVKCIQNVWKKWLSSYEKALNASLKPSLPLHPVGFLQKKNALVTFLPWLRAFLIKQINFQRSNAIHGQHPFIFDRNIIAYEYYFTTKGRYLLSTYKSLSFTFSLAHLSYEWSKIRNIQFEVINANLSLSHSFVLRFCNFIQLYWKDENLENPHMFENLTH